jgi:hypothetical protein
MTDREREVLSELALATEHLHGATEGAADLVWSDEGRAGLVVVTHRLESELDRLLDADALKVDDAIVRLLARDQPAGGVA